MAAEALLRLLYASLDPDPSVRAQGEAGLAAGAQQPGFGLALAQVSTSPDLPYGIKQLAAVVLKKFVKARPGTCAGAVRPRGLSVRVQTPTLPHARVLLSRSVR